MRCTAWYINTQLTAQVNKHILNITDTHQKCGSNCWTLLHSPQLLALLFGIPGALRVPRPL